MKTPVGMQLKILDKMRENVESSKWLFDQIQYSSSSFGWVDKENSILNFMDIEYRIKPQTITINGIEIPKPLTFNEMEIIKDSNTTVFFPCLTGSLYVEMNVRSAFMDMNENTVCYMTKSVAIEASKLFFGIKD